LFYRLRRLPKVAQAAAEFALLSPPRAADDALRAEVAREDDEAHEQALAHAAAVCKVNDWEHNSRFFKI
jgi:hypothetical protein